MCSAVGKQGAFPTGRGGMKTCLQGLLPCPPGSWQQCSLSPATGSQEGPPGLTHCL